MGKLTKEEIARIEKELSMPWGRVKLQCDTFLITVEVRRIAKLKFSPIAFVDGTIDYDWVITDCEQRRRFMRPTYRYLYTPTRRKELEKIFGKRRAAKQFDLDKKITYYGFDWPSVKSMVRHFCAANESVAVIECGVLPTTKDASDVK